MAKWDPLGSVTDVGANPKENQIDCSKPIITPLMDLFGLCTLELASESKCVFKKYIQYGKIEWNS